MHGGEGEVAPREQGRGRRVVRLKTLAMFGEWSAFVENQEALFKRVMEVGRLERVCSEMELPYTVVWRWINGDERVKARYEQARAAWAEGLVDEALEIADSVLPEKGHVSKAKLQTDVRFGAAKSWNRARFGDAVKHETTVNVNADAGLVGFAGELLAKLGRRQPRVIEVAPGQALTDSSSVGTPAPESVE